MALAGRNIPQVLFVPDIEPGQALKGLAHYANVIALTAEDLGNILSKNKARGHRLPCPVRFAEVSSFFSPASMGLNDDLPVLFIVGGSKGLD